MRLIQCQQSLREQLYFFYLIKNELMIFCRWMCVHKIIEKSYVLQFDVVMLFVLSSFILFWVLHLDTNGIIFFYVCNVFVLYIVLLLYMGLATLVNILNHLDNDSSRFCSNQIYICNICFLSISLSFFFFLSIWWLVKYNWHLVWKLSGS